MSTPYANLRNRSNNWGLGLMISRREYFRRTPTGMQSRNCYVDFPSRSSSFIRAAEVKRKIGRSKTGLILAIICLIRTTCADHSSLFPAKQTKIESGRSERFGKMRVFDLRVIFRFRDWRHYSKTLFFSDPTAEFRILLQPQS